jgi:hypothetical protein
VTRLLMVMSELGERMPKGADKYPRHEGLEIFCLVMVAACLITAAITLFSQGHSNRR